MLPPIATVQTAALRTTGLQGMAPAAVAVGLEIGTAVALNMQRAARLLTAAGAAALDETVTQGALAAQAGKVSL